MRVKRTSAQTARDAALRRLVRLNRSLAVAAVAGAGVLTDVVAHTGVGKAQSPPKSATVRVPFAPGYRSPKKSRAQARHTTTPSVASVTPSVPVSPPAPVVVSGGS